MGSEDLLASVHAVLRYYRARQRAERKTRRMALLVELASAVHAAQSVTECLRAAVHATARIFDGPAVVTAVTGEGRVLTAEISGPAGVAVLGSLGPSGADLFEGAGAAEVHRAPGGEWSGTAAGAGATDVWSVTARSKDGGTLVHLAVCATGFAEDDLPVLRQWGQTLALAVEAAGARGEHWAAEVLQRTVPTQRGSFTSPGRPEWAQLTPREREIAVLVAAGHTSQRIAALLMIAKRTVDAHIAHILAKLGFCSRTQIATWVVELRATGLDTGRHFRT